MPAMIRPDRLQALGLDANEAEHLSRRADELIDRAAPAASWTQISRFVLRPDHPFEVHQYVCELIFAGWKEERGPRPIWSPTDEDMERANIRELLERFSLGDYESLQRWSVTHGEAFWETVIELLGIRFRRRPQRMLDSSEGPQRPRWLVGAQLNITDSCFTADARAPAIVFDTVSGQLERQTYGELRELTCQVSNGLINAGLGPGDAIAIDMPMTAESVAIYLGIVQAGGIVVSIADSFAAPQIAARLTIAGAKAIFTMGSIVRDGKALPLYEKVIAAEAPRAIVLDGDDGDQPALRQNDVRWCDFLSDKATFDSHAASADTLVNILFSSGTTGDPKAIPWDHVTPIRCAADARYHHDIHVGDVLCWPTSLGWMMGPWLIFAALVNRGTIALSRHAPTGRSFGQFVQDAKVNMLGVVPSLVRRWRQTECMKGLDWSSIRAFSNTGECSNAPDMHYLMHLAGYRPIIEYCGGTEIGGGYITSTVVQPNAPGTFSTIGLGFDFVILDDHGAPADTGELFLIPPSLGLSAQLLNADHDQVYFDDTPPGPNGQVLRRHGDQFQRLPGGYYRGLGRVDDTMNLGGIKVGAAEIERVLSRVDGVKETAAIAVTPPDGGPVQLVIFAIADEAVQVAPDYLRSQMQQAIKRDLNPLFKVHDVRVIDALPRTASNKVMRRRLRAAYEEPVET